MGKGGWSKRNGNGKVECNPKAKRTRRIRSRNLVVKIQHYYSNGGRDFSKEECPLWKKIVCASNRILITPRSELFLFCFT